MVIDHLSALGHYFSFHVNFSSTLSKFFSSLLSQVLFSNSSFCSIVSLILWWPAKVLVFLTYIFILNIWFRIDFFFRTYLLKIVYQLNLMESWKLGSWQMINYIFKENCFYKSIVYHFSGSAVWNNSHRHFKLNGMDLVFLQML